MIDALYAYLVYVIVISLLFGLVVLRLKKLKLALTAGLIIFVLLLPLLIGYFYMMYVNSLPEVIVPNLSGQTSQEAAEKVEELNLKVKEAGRANDQNIPEGVIVSQRPEPGRMVKEGRTINVIVSAGKTKVIAPSLVDRSYIQADQILTAAGLKLGEIKFENNTGGEPGKVVAQEPMAGEEVELGMSVDLLVAATEEVKQKEQE
ncbi:MAG: PASTA domain-containing protein [bacterium]